MYLHEWQTAVRNVLEYCRDPRYTLDVGRALGPVLLARECPASDWTITDDWALAAALKQLIHAQIACLRAAAGCTAPVSTSVAQHAQLLKLDTAPTQARDALKFWSLLWAYYICAMSHEEIAGVCGWSTRLSQLRVKQAREIYLVHKLGELGHQQRQHDDAARTSCGTCQHSQRTLVQPARRYSLSDPLRRTPIAASDTPEMW